MNTSKKVAKLPEYRKIWRESVTKDGKGRFTPTVYEMFELALMKAFHSKTNRDKVQLALDIISQSFAPKSEKKYGKAFLPPFDGWLAVKRRMVNYNFVVEGKLREVGDKAIVNIKSETYRPLFHVFIDMFHGKDAFELQKFNTFINAVYKAIWNSKPSDLNETKYLYVFVRDDLSNEQKLVQASHATCEVGAEIGNESVKNLHFSVLSTVDEYSLEEVIMKLEARGIKHKVFVEPDLGNSKTVVSTLPIGKGYMRDFKKYKTLKVA